MSIELVEGYFIITVDNLIFEVKGIVHPRNRVVAYLRYVPTSSGYKKIYDLNERESYLQKNYPSYLWFSEPHGRVIQSVSSDKIKSILNPVDCLKSLQNRVGDISDLEESSVNLAEKLIESTGIRWSDIGITGSQLVGVAKKDSDIDLVVFGERACRKFYSELFQAITTIPGVTRYVGSLLDEHVSFRWKAHTKLRPILREIEHAKILQGMFGGYHFFVRLVKTPKDFDQVFGDLSFQMRGQQFVSGSVIEDSESMFTPCEYLVVCDEIPNLRKLVSYRGRFTEQVSKGASFQAQGRLELVRDHRENDQYLQLVLGELPTDYLIPT
ncbi:MAG: nucleotidyltransferase domain-containing protein [Candidatus Thorarchaeota archaeon]